MTETAGRERGCHSAVLFTSKTITIYEWNEHTDNSDSRSLTKYLNLIKSQTNPNNWWPTRNFLIKFLHYIYFYNMLMDSKSIIMLENTTHESEEISLIYM